MSSGTRQAHSRSSTSARHTDVRRGQRYPNRMGPQEQLKRVKLEGSQTGSSICANRHDVSVPPLTKKQRQTVQVGNFIWAQGAGHGNGVGSKGEGLAEKPRRGNGRWMPCMQENFNSRERTSVSRRAEGRQSRTQEVEGIHCGGSQPRPG